MNPVEEKLYEIAGAEIATKNVNLGAWTKAFSVALGDEAKTKAVYIQLRVDQLREQLTAELQQRNETAEQCRTREDDDIRSRLSSLRDLPFEDTDKIPSSRFDGSPTALQCPVAVSRASLLTDMLEFEIIDLIKRGYLKGIRQDREWYFDLNQVALPR